MSPRKAAPRLRLTDTTFRDGNQSLLGGHMRGDEIVPIAAKMDSIGFYSMEAFGGATFEVLVRDRQDPWQYLRRLKEVLPNTPVQALIRGQNLVAHHNFADDVVELFISHAARCGVDVFRVFDPLNDLRNMEAAIAAAKQAGKKVQGALSYAISPAHNLDLWCSLAKGLVKLGCDDIVIKDTSGLLSPQATWELVTALRDVVKAPIVVHSHCASGMAPMAYMAAVEAGATVLDTAMSPLAWGASQPATESVVAALAGGDYDTGLDLELLVDVKDDIERVKEAHVEHLSPVADRVDSDILRYKIPGLMLEDIYRQLQQHHAGKRLKEVLGEIAVVREELGFPPLVTPIRHMIASQAVLNVIGGDRYATVTQELKDYLQGLYGRPPRPARPEIRRLVLGREEPITIRPADLLEPQVGRSRAELKKQGVNADDGDVLIHLLFPAIASAYFSKDASNGKRRKGGAGEAGGKPGQEKGEDQQAQPHEHAASKEQSQAVGNNGKPEGEQGQPAAPPAQAAEFQVEVEGEVFTVRVSGAGMAAAPRQSGGDATPQPAAPTKPTAGGGNAVVAPMQGLIVKLPKQVGDEVKLGDVVAVLEAMKMQNDIVSTAAGKVQEVHVKEGEVVGPNQAIVSIG